MSARLKQTRWRAIFLSVSSGERRLELPRRCAASQSHREQAGVLSCAGVSVWSRGDDAPEILRAEGEFCLPFTTAGLFDDYNGVAAGALGDRGGSGSPCAGLSNLLNNAAKFIENGGFVRPASEQIDGRKGVMRRESVIGIPGEMLPRVFDLFTQIDRIFGRVRGGLGIGLASVKRVVELRGRDVEAHGEGLGRGSAFVVRLRLAAEEGATVPMSNTVSNDLPVSRRILVIDDDHDVADSLVMFLETFGADVRVAYDCEGGVAAVQEFHPDLVFLDLGMPKIDGYETARRIRALPEGRDVKLVALTGWGQGQIRERAQDAGFDCQLTKPAGIEALQTLLNTM